MSCAYKKKSYKRKASVKRRRASLFPCSFNAAGAAFAALFLLFAGCGIELYIYFEPVTTYINKPGSDADEASNYVAFETSDVANLASASSSYFKGFEIYYRIYNNITTLNTEVAAIDSYNEDDSTQAMAHTYLTSTRSYKRLAAANSLTDMPLISLTGASSSNNRAVYIRIYNAVSTFTAGVKVYELASPMSASEEGMLLADYGSPRRTINGLSRNSDRYSFELDNITSSDDDVSWGTATIDGTFYVQFYVAAYGYDESFSSIYSALYNLGYITLTEDYEDRGM